MRFIKPLIIFLITITASSAFGQANYTHISNYKVYYGWAHLYPQDWMVLRSFENAGRPYYLMVNPQTLETKVTDAGFYKITPMTIEKARDFFKNTPYIKALQKAENQSITMQVLNAVCHRKQASA
ncbi:hypothetical protein D0C36_09970 [Mucilaginibacter conchicola]|uniref:Uncharacterized protein n=1 Tax=Mucilaginibacter conchicola TaxID=2303333 RepID=A0A372NS38_9SPHI|nr:hypothetical protein [Mucilaginibacter conchicola]RFZ91774.1 hypothetical protein D0C36_09970 [Mucilaginibacter conchicola]